MYMKFRKTKTAARSVYVYRFADGTVAVLHPGEQGVSPEIIGFLHKLDDREVYRNLKQRKVKEHCAKPVDTEVESLEIQRFVQSYAEAAGYLSQSGRGRKSYDTGSKRRRRIGNGNSASYDENQSPNQEKILIFLLMGFDFMLIFSTAFMEGGGA